MYNSSTMGLHIESNVILAPYTTFGIGGEADYFCIAQSTQDIIDAVAFAKQKNLDYFLLGSGANILIGDRGFRGLVIKNEAKRVEGSISQELDSSTTPALGEASLGMTEYITAESGITIKELINICLEEGLSGLEHFAGIPSTLGGALWQNLHFLSPDRLSTVFIGDIVEEAEVLKEDGEVIRVQKEYFHFDYDYSILHDTKDIVLAATLRLTPEKKEVIQQRITANIQWRNEKHPENATKCSAGSVFKKIEGYGAGRLIEKVGLKGYQFGGAQISPKHANFIINTGDATAADVRSLINIVQEKVKKELGLELQTEISFVGEF